MAESCANGDAVKKRILSIDALRGFDMIWISGVSRVLIRTGRALNNDFGAAMVAQMKHVPWEGLHIIDLVFPTFVFLAGASWPFSLESQRRKGATDREIFLRILKRFAILFFLGLIYAKAFCIGYTRCLYDSVLARVGFGWAVAAATLLFCKRLRRVVFVAAGIFIAYWAVSLAIPLLSNPPGANPWMPRENGAVYIVDMWLISLLGKAFGPELLNFHRQALLSAVGCVPTAFIGMFCGLMLQNKLWSSLKKSGVLAVFAAALAAGGALLYLTGCPIVKNSWNPTYILVAGAISTGLLALFHFIIDVLGWVRWSFLFRVIGANSIAIYMLYRVVDLEGTSGYLLNGVAGMLPEPWAKVLLGAGGMLLGWGVMLWLYRRKIFFKV